MMLESRALSSLFALVAVAACSVEPNPVSTSSDSTMMFADEVPVDSTIAALIEERVPRATAGDAGWPYLQRATADFDGDGALETAVLLSDVTLDAAGRPLWEDGHRWQVYIEEADSTRMWVYARFLPNGTLQPAVLQPAPGRPPTLLLREETPDRVALYEIAYGGTAGSSMMARFERALDPASLFAGAPRP